MKVKSKKPRKQRKALYNYKHNQRSKLLSCRLADFLQEAYEIKRLPLRIDDSVRVTRGEFRDFEGTVLEITKNLRVKVKECVFEKTDGTQFHPTIHVSNLIITKLRREGRRMDTWRASMIEKKAGHAYWEEEITAPKKEKRKLDKEEYY